MAENGVEKEGLAKNAVGLWHAIFLGFSHSAPAADVASLLIGVALVAYGAMPLAMLLGVILYLAIANTNWWYSRNVASAGGYYSFISHGLSSKASLYGAWFQQFYELYTYALFGSLGFATTLYLYFPYLSSVPYLWVPLFFIPQVTIFLLAYWGIRPSLRYVLYTGSAEAVFLLVTSLIIIVRAGPSNTLSVFTFSPVKGSVTAVFFGLLFAADSMTGAISPVSLGEEIREPKKNLPRAFFGSVAIAGIVLIVASYALTVGWGVNNMSTFGNYANPGQIVFFRYLGPIGGYLLALFILNSYFSCGVAGCTDLTRMWYAMGRDGVLFPRQFGEVHPKYRSPHKAVLALFLVSSVIAIVAGVALGPLNATISLAITSTVSWIVVKVATSAGLPLFAKRHLGRIRVFYHVVVPTVVVVTSLIILYSTYVPLPSGPLFYGAILTPVYAVIGAVWIEVFCRRHPELVVKAGKHSV
jgi:amino acid transporter